jgi:hypothetical protein
MKNLKLSSTMLLQQISVEELNYQQAVRRNKNYVILRKIKTKIKGLKHTLSVLDTSCDLQSTGLVLPQEC